jgi:cyanophycin synthetase
MEFGRLWVLRGPNAWARVPVLEVEVRLDPTRWPADLGARLVARLAGLGGCPDRAPDELSRAPSPVHALQIVAMDLQCLTDCDVNFAVIRAASTPGCWRMAFEYEEEALGRACLQSARALCLAARDEQPFDPAAELRQLREVAHDVKLGPSTAAIVRAARRRGIPVRRLNDASLVQLGHGARARRICAAETDRTSAVAETVAKDKELTRALLHAVGVPVPKGRAVADADDAWAAAQDIGLPVVVKPRDGNHGRGVAANLSTRAAVHQAYAAALAESDQVIVERFIPGVDYRLLVIGGRLVAAALREPAHVVGDGRSSILQLVEETNRDPLRSDGHATALSYLKLDAVSLSVLAEQGFTPESIPPAQSRVLIRRNGNLSTGGTATDVTDRVHPETARRAVEAARAVGLDIAGVDVVTTDVARPLDKVGGAVVEVNAGPGLRMHLEPSAGKPRPVGEAIVEMVFPEARTGRIPIAAVTGVNGKTTTTRLLAHLLHQGGATVGMTCSDGAFIGARCIDAHDGSGPRSAGLVLLNPRVEAAVFETGRGGILREGLGFDQCDVAVVTNIGGGDHLGLHGVSTAEELAQVKRTVVEAVAPGGAAVLNAEDPLVAAMASHCPGSVIFFARQAAAPPLVAHRRGGGRTAFIRAGVLVLAEGEREEVVASLDQVPMTHGGRVPFQVENALAATAAAWALGLSPEQIRKGLATFAADVRQTPGRCNAFAVGGATVLIDAPHNASALAALTEALDAFPHRRRVIVFRAVNRRDGDVMAMGAALGNGFDRVVMLTDAADGARPQSELNDLLRQGLRRGKRVVEIHEAESEESALDDALRTLQAEDLLVLGVTAVDESKRIPEQLLVRGATASTAAVPARAN